MVETQEKNEEPPDSSDRYFSRIRVEDDLKTAAGQVIKICDMLIRHETPNGELTYIQKLAGHLRGRIETAGDRLTIRETTYLGGLLEMLGRFSDIPNGATFPRALLEFADGLERLPRSSPENVRKYRDALTSLTSYINAQENPKHLALER